MQQIGFIYNHLVSFSIEMYAGFGKDFDHQVTRDLLSSATLAFEGKDFEQQKAAQRTWKEVARDFWAKQAAETDNEKRRNPK